MSSLSTAQFPQAARKPPKYQHASTRRNCRFNLANGKACRAEFADQAKPADEVPQAILARDRSVTAQQGHHTTPC